MPDRFSAVDGLPVVAARAVKAKDSEVEQVRILRAKWRAAKRVAARRRFETNENRRMLAGDRNYYGGSSGTPSATDAAVASAGVPQIVNADVFPTNLFLRGTLQAKSEACDENWTTRCHGVGDLPPEISDAIVDDAETLVEKVMSLGAVTREFSDSIDDSATIGPMMVKHGVGRDILSRASLSGGAQKIEDVVLAAANWQDGQPPVDPLPGMDFPALSSAARGFITPEQAMVRTKEQLDQLEQLAAKSDAMWVKALDQRPDGYEIRDVWYRRVVYGDDVLWDPTVTTRWDDSRWMGFLIRMPLEVAQREPAFKASARAQLVGVKTSKADGWEEVTGEGLGEEVLAGLNEFFVGVEWWDKDTGQVHYFTEEEGGYDGFLERDSLYPHFNDKMRTILKSWYPVSVAIPVMHNLPLPERTQGIGWLEPGRAHAKLYVLADSALTASRKKAGRIIEGPSDLPELTKQAILSGEDLAYISRPPDMDPGKNLIVVHTFGESPVDLAMMRDDALKSFSASIGLTLPEATGQANEPTLGQTVIATKGPQARRQGLIRKMQAMAGDIAQDTASYIRRYYSDDKVTELMGRDFTTPTPYMVQDPMNPGGPKVQAKDPKTGQPVMIPSKWSIWKNASTPWDQWEVVFNPSAQGQDLMRAKAASDFSTQIQAMIDPILKVPYFDPRPLLEHQAKAMGFGRLRKFPVSPEQLAALLGIGGQPPGGDTNAQGGDAAQGQGGPSGRETPGGGRSDSRIAGGGRGPQPVPHRQDRHEGGSDVGDSSVQAHRIGAA